MYNMQPYSQDGSGSRNGSSGKGTSNRNVVASAGFQDSRSPRAAHNTEAFSAMAWPYDLPEPRTPPGRRNPLGKHRVRVELNRLNQEILFLREELKAIDNIPPASKACKELVEFMETCPDPLLPVTAGAVTEDWDRWFRKPVEPPHCCW